MNNQNDLKEKVQEKYTAIAKGEQDCCIDTGCCGDGNSNIMAENYEDLEGYEKDADLNLGCGLPTEHANIQPNQVVLDLGSGAGNDCFIARNIVGEDGFVYGLDFTPEMNELAQKNQQKLGFGNMKFVQGDIEAMPFDDELTDVIVSNCVMNLVPDKRKAYNEVYRVLKTGGHFCISDIVYNGEMPEGFLQQAELYAGCVTGASEKVEYLNIIKESGFKDIELKKERIIDLPDELLNQYLTNEQVEDYKSKVKGLLSVTVYAVK